MIRVVIFDMNGVITNDEPLHEQAFRETLQPFGITLTHADYQKYFLGRSDRAGFEYVVREHPLTMSLEKLYQQKMNRYGQLARGGTPLVPGAITAIQRLAQSFRLALTTGASRAEADMVFAQYSLAPYFRVVVSTEDFDHGKPDPEPYLLTAERLGVSPSECLVIEDSAMGVQSAKAAGMYCIAITTTSNEPDLRAADHIASALNEITAHLIQSIASNEQSDCQKK